MSPVIRTLTGHCFRILEPRKYSYSITEIAEVLSRIGRFNNHTLSHYSVAQHSVLVSDIVYRRTGYAALAIQGLMHDAAEAFSQDIMAPLKHLLDRSAYVTIEHDIEQAIAAYFGLPAEFHPSVKQADSEAVHAEIRDLMCHDFDEEEWPGFSCADLDRMVAHEPLLSLRIEPLPAAEARDLFLSRYQELKYGSA